MKRLLIVGPTATLLLGVVVTPGMAGQARATTQFRGQISHDKWYIGIHQGPTLQAKGGTRLIACGNVS